MIEQAKQAGADYVLTPEMTNIMEIKRERLFAAITEEERDPTLAALRETARELSIYLHIGSLAIKVSHDKAANRSFLIDRRGDIVARYDKIHMFDVDLANGESYRESNNYRPGELGGAGRSAVGPARPDGLLRSALPCALSRARGGRRIVSGDSVRVHQADRRSALARADAGARHRKRLLRLCRRPRRHARKRPRRPSAIRSWSIPGAAVLAEGGNEPGIILAESIRPQSPRRVRAFPRCMHGRRFEVIEPMAEPTHLHAVRGSP